MKTCINKLKALFLGISLGSTFAGSAYGALNGQFIYAAQDDGTIHVYDINNSHAQVKVIRVFSTAGADIRGVCAAAPTHRIYVMYVVGTQGRIACVDLTNDSVVFNKSYPTRVDRGDVSHDGSKLYVPSSETQTNPWEYVLDANGNEIHRITMPSRTHDTFVSADGTKVFTENKSTDDRIRTISVASDQVIATTKPFAAIVQPFSVNGKNTLMIADVQGIYGFQYGDISTGQVFGTALFTGTTNPLGSATHPHGIGMTPNELEAWVCDRGTGNHFVHVFDISNSPAQAPRQTRLVTVSNDDPHWLTFDVDGRFCYVAGSKGLNQKTDVISTSSYNRVAALSPSEDMLEVDFNSAGTVTRTGDQFGIGRVTGGNGSIANGTYKIINRNSGLALDVANNGTANGSNVNQATYTGSNNQRWTVSSLGGGEYSIISVNSGKMVEVMADSKASGANVDQLSSNGGSNQQWILQAP